MLRKSVSADKLYLPATASSTAVQCACHYHYHHHHHHQIAMIYDDLPLQAVLIIVINPWHQRRHGAGPAPHK
jgi:hypothetical protein